MTLWLEKNKALKYDIPSLGKINYTRSMKKIIHIIFVLVCLYLGYCLPDSLPNEGMFLNSRNPSRGFGNN